MKIYLDNCALQRPLDEKNQIRIILEAEAVLGILNYFEEKEIELVSSEVLIFEIQKNQNVTRKEYAYAVLSKAVTFVRLNTNIEKRAKVLQERGIKPVDALHLASAEMAGVDYFCTCDDKLVKKAKSLGGLIIKIVTPLELIEEIEK